MHANDFYNKINEVTSRIRLIYSDKNHRKVELVNLDH